MRLGILTTHPVQYYVPLYRALARELDLEVFFSHRQTAAGQAAAGFGVGFEWDVPLLDGYAHTFLDNRARRPSTDTFAGTHTPEIGRLIRQGKFDAFLVQGWYTRSLWQAMIACWTSGTPLLIRGDSHLGTPRSGVRRAVKEVLYRSFIPRYDGYLVVGEQAREYLLYYGADPARMDFTPHFVDAEFFRTHAARADRAALRAELGSGPDTLWLLFVGKLLPEKRPADLISAAAALRAQGRDVRVAYVGAGPLAADLGTAATVQDVPIRRLGFKNQTELPAYYAAADLLVLPSDSETWGLVVNEAFACGTPAVVSDAVGCRPDLITDADPGRTGAAFPVGDPAALAAAVERVIPHLGTDALARALAARSDTYSLQASVDGTVRAVERVSTLVPQPAPVVA